MNAITILSKVDQNKETVDKLLEIYHELPLSTWTRESIIDAIEDYAIEHNNMLPYEKELTTENHLPSNTVIYNKFGISSIRNFYLKFFSQYLTKNNRKESPYSNFSQKDFKEVFVENYYRIKAELRIKHVNFRLYDIYRADTTPCVNTIMRNCNCSTYNDLLVICGLKEESKPLETNVSIAYNDDETWHNDIRDYFDKIKKDIQI